jgi:hypothetical protein
VADPPKQIFVVVMTREAHAIVEEIKKNNLSHQAIKNDAWLVSYSGTTRALSELLKIRSEPHVGNGVVLAVSGYSGRAESAVWEWLKINWPQNG